MSTLYFCTFLHLYFVQIVHTNFCAKSGVSSSKNEHVMFNLVFSAVLLLLGSQNVAIDQGIYLRVVPTSYNSLFLTKPL